MADVLANYRPGAAFDEMIDAEGSVRPSYKAVHATLQRSSADRAPRRSPSRWPTTTPRPASPSMSAASNARSPSIWCPG